MASPDCTKPSRGIRLPHRTTTRSPLLICETGKRISVPSVFTHAFSTPSDMVLARSSTDFLCVHSSKISPIFSKNMTEAAVRKSPLSSDTEIAVASSTLTSIFPLHKLFNPFHTYLHALINAKALRTGSGRNHFLRYRLTTVITSRSSYFLSNARPVCSGTSPIFSVFS